MNFHPTTVNSLSFVSVKSLFENFYSFSILLFIDTIQIYPYRQKHTGARTHAQTDWHLSISLSPSEMQLRSSSVYLSLFLRHSHLLTSPSHSFLTHPNIRTISLIFPNSSTNTPFSVSISLLFLAAGFSLNSLRYVLIRRKSQAHLCIIWKKVSL